MASAFQCDLCRYCEPGEPMVRFKLEATGANHPSEEWCTDCLSSYEAWRATRLPIIEDIDPADDHDEDATDECDPPVPMQGHYA